MKLEIIIRHGISFLYNHEDIVSFALKYTAEQMAKARRLGCVIIFCILMSLAIAFRQQRTK